MTAANIPISATQMVGNAHATGQTDRPAEYAFRGLLRTCGLLGRAMHPYFAQFGISGSQWGVLRTLYRAHQEGAAGLRLTDLSGRLLIRPPSVTGVVDRLVRMGLVAREPSSTDARAKEVRLTPVGQDTVERVMNGHANEINKVLGGLSREEQAHLHRLLEQLAAHLETMIGGEESPVE